jgi:hypothetical protein
VKLADFGIAKAERREAHTAAGALKGKYAYMSPEQALGEAVDRRSDVWSLGVVGHELFTGRRLFHRESELKVLQALTQEPVPHPSDKRVDLPREIDAILLRALERDPARRYPSAKAFGLALEEFVLANGEAGARLQIARFLRELFGEQVAAERRRMAVGDVDVQGGEGTEARPPPEDSVSLASGDLRLRGGGGRGLLIATSLLALGAAAAIFLAARQRGASGEETPPSPAAAIAAPAPAQPAPRPEAAPVVVERPRPAAPARAKLVVDVKPTVVVWLDGENLGPAPIEGRELAPGKHVLVLAGAAEGFRIEEPFQVAAGATHTVKRALRPGRLVVPGKKKTEVFDGDRRLGKAPLELALTEGTWRLTLRRGKQRKDVEVEIRAGEVTKVDEAW